MTWAALPAGGHEHGPANPPPEAPPPTATDSGETGERPGEGLQPAAVDPTRPLFQLPLPCDDTWTASTYPNHGGGGNDWPIDLNHDHKPDYEKNAEVWASAEGVVAEATFGGGYGNYVVIDHGDGWSTLYAHLKSLSDKAEPDTRVQQGDVLGVVGGTGGVPVHLHYEQRKGGMPREIVLDGVEVPYHPDMYWTGPNLERSPERQYEVTSNNCPTTTDTPPVDLFMIVDTSGSFADDLDGFKADAAAMISSITASNPNTRFGLGTFEDYPISPFGDALTGDVAYRRNLDLTSDTSAMLSAVDSLFTRSGLDGPESQLAAVYQAASGVGHDLSGVGHPAASIPPGQNASFRNGAQKIILLWTDAGFHLPGDPGDSIPYPGPGLLEAASAVLALDPPKVVGISVEGGDASSDLADLAQATNTVAGSEGVDCDGDGVIDIPEGAPIVCTSGAGGAGLAGAVEATVQSIGDLPYWWAGSHISAERFTTRVTLRWPSAVDNAPIAAYRLFQNGAPVATVDDTTTTVTGLSPDTEYQFTVQAVDSDGNATVDGPSTTVRTAPSFVDTAGSVFVDDIAWLAAEGITKGCNPPANDRFCPVDPVTRGQMAAFLSRFLPPPHPGGEGAGGFVDVGDSIFEAEIQNLATIGVTKGCNPPANDRFCPDDPVTRGQMAAFLVRALGLADDGGGNGFIDDDGSVFEADAARLAAAGVTKGCNPPVDDRFCPEDPVTRGQMAAFLHRALTR